MKIRNGFVSNSSSSSFCVYGTLIEYNDDSKESIRSNISQFFEKNKDIILDYISKQPESHQLYGKTTVEEIVEEMIEEDCFVNIFWRLQTYLQGIESEDVKKVQALDGYTEPYEDNDIYVGIEWCEIGGEETGNQFKKRIEDAIELLFGKDFKYTTYEEAFSDNY